MTFTQFVCNINIYVLDVVALQLFFFNHLKDSLDVAQQSCWMASSGSSTLLKALTNAYCVDCFWHLVCLSLLARLLACYSYPYFTHRLDFGLMYVRLMAYNISINLFRDARSLLHNFHSPNSLGFCINFE